SIWPASAPFQLASILGSLERGQITSKDLLHRNRDGKNGFNFRSMRPQVSPKCLRKQFGRHEETKPTPACVSG
ncbi:hypothetical protein BaRGS_00026562, partial [Batillaria attramentaria]